MIMIMLPAAEQLRAAGAHADCLDSESQGKLGLLLASEPGTQLTGTRRNALLWGALSHWSGRRAAGTLFWNLPSCTRLSLTWLVKLLALPLKNSMLAQLTDQSSRFPGGLASYYYEFQGSAPTKVEFYHSEDCSGNSTAPGINFDCVPNRVFGTFARGPDTDTVGSVLLTC